MKILSFGEIIWDIFPEKKCIGGAPLNFAAHAKKQGAESYMLSAVGGDRLGLDAVCEVERFGIDTKYITVVQDKPTGQCIVTLDENMVPSYNLLNDTAYDVISATEELYKDSFDVVSFGTLALRGEHNIETVKNMLNNVKFNEVFSDLNIRAPYYSKETVMLCLENATIVKISDEELPVVCDLVFGRNDFDYKTAARMLSEKFKQLKIVVITRGGEGSYAYDCISGNEFSSAGEKVEVVSTVGAGDSFGAAFLVHYINGKSIQECLNIATKVSAYVVAHIEAVPD